MVSYTVSSYVHSFPKKSFNSIKDYAKEILEYIYSDKKQKTVVHIQNVSDMELMIYVLIDMGNEIYDLDFIRIIDMKDSITQSMCQSKHTYAYNYLNINHNPIYVSAPKFMVEKLLNCKDYFANNGVKWLVKMENILTRMDNRKEFKSNLKSQQQATLQAVEMANMIVKNKTLKNNNLTDDKKAKATTQVVPAYIQELRQKQSSGKVVISGL